MKHYSQIANVIQKLYIARPQDERDLLVNDTLELVADDLATFFARDTYPFQKAEFINACKGLMEDI